MKLIKLWYHIIAARQRVFYKLLYGRRLQIIKNVTWRRGFSIMMSKEARVVIGDNCFFNNDCSIAANNLVTICVGSGLTCRVLGGGWYNLRRECKDL